METVLVVIPKPEQKKWLDGYETLVPTAAVPRSAQIITEEDDCCLYSVVVLKKNLDTFIKAASEQKFIVRSDFKFEEGAAALKNAESGKLETEIKQQWVIQSYDFV